MRHQTTPHLLALSRGAAAVAVVAALVGCGARTGVAAIAPADATPTSAHSATPGHAATPAAHSATTLAHSVTATRTGTSRSSAGVATDRRIAADGR